VDNIQGTIEHVGLKTTRIRSVTGEQVIIANADLLKSRIRNHKRMQHRRAAFNLDLAFDTPPEKIARIPGLVRRIVEAQPNVRFDRSHWLTIEPSGLRVETVYNVLDPDYGKFADVQQAINIEILRALQQERIQFGYATRTTTLSPAET
jgi:small-conductance mechanosensitive channel